MKQYLALLIICFGGVIAETFQLESYTCGSPAELTNIKKNTGILNIKRNVTECGFMAPEDTKIFMIKIQDLKLKFKDSIEISSYQAADPTPVYSNPPFDAGYLISGIKSPKIIFKFNGTDDTNMLVEYFLDVQTIPFNGDINNQFAITPLNVTQIVLKSEKTSPDLVHVEVEGAHIKGTSLPHALLDEKDNDVTIQFSGNQKVVVKSSIARADCSSSIDDSKEASHEINGPSNVTASAYKCVNIFKTSMSDPAHYVADFSNFVDLTDVDDKVLLDDGSANYGVNIVKTVASDYTGQVLYFRGRELALIYDSPRTVSRTQIQFKMTIKSVANGGIIENPGKLTFPSGGQISYLLVPELQQYATVEFSDNLRLQDVNITISIGNKAIAKFEGSTRLPPIIASSMPNAKMTIDFSAKSFNQLANSVSFKSVASSCHKLTSGNFGGFSVNGIQSECYWTLASTNNVGLSFDYQNLYPNGCLTIQPLSLDKPIFSKCNLTQVDLLPTFVVEQAYIKVTNGSRLDASLSATTNAMVVDRSASGSSQAIYSQGYPVVNVWSSDSQNFLLNLTRGSHIVSFDDIDLRSGEKMLVNNNIVSPTLREDMILPNVTASNITVVRSPATADFGVHRGFKVSTTSYDQIIIADISKKNITTPKNLTSLFIKISSPGAKGKFGKRIFVTAASNFTKFNYSIHDGRSLLSRIITDAKNASSTSDTLLLSFSISKPNTTLPEMIIEYGTSVCNTTADHICDDFTRCVSVDKLCKGVSYCNDGSDIKLLCSSSGPLPSPKVIETGVAGITVFILCILMLTLGAVSASYGPDVFKTLKNRFRFGPYTPFTSTD